MPEQLANILESGGTEVGTAAGGARRYRKPLKSFRWRDIVCIFNASFGDWSKHKAPRLGASCLHRRASANKMSIRPREFLPIY
jgi:hypothetical protein